jgi:outer membrane protein insertion porin family
LVGLSAGVRRADAAPLSEVQFEGLRLIEEGTVRLQLTSKPGSEYSEATVQEDIKKIYRMGYFDQVGVKTATEGGAVRVTFVVMEKPAIRNIFLQGNEEVNDETIKQKRITRASVTTTR